MAPFPTTFFRPKLFLWILAGGWVTASLISLGHLLKKDPFPFLSVGWMGIFGWILFFFTALYLNRSRLLYAVILFIGFFMFGFIKGPFLEPGGDTFNHIGLTHRNVCGKQLSEIAPKNSDVWHYSMNSLLICKDSSRIEPERFLRKLDILNGVYWGLMVTVLFALSSAAGLPTRWAIFSVCCCFLFFGTNRFSFFSYYSFGGSFTSIMIYWMWMAYYFFKNSINSLILGTLAGLFALPIIWVNHFQEAAFLGFAMVVWMTIKLGDWVWSLELGKTNNRRDIKKTWLIRSIFVITLFVVCFLLPQSSFFKYYLSKLFIGDRWAYNSIRVMNFWGDYHLWGKVWGHRVHDTLGLLSVLPIPMAIIAFCIPRKYYPDQYFYSGKMLLVGLLPFVYLFIPLISFTWVSNVGYSIYYRICYSSLFWITIAYFLFLCEGFSFALTDRVVLFARNKKLDYRQE